MGKVPSIIRIDDREWQNLTILIQYRDVSIPLSRARLIELLGREERMFALLKQTDGTQGSEQADAESGNLSHVESAAHDDGKAALGSLHPVKGEVSHGSLSYRITRIVDFSMSTKRLRPAHAGVLSELLESFDWSLPENPNSRIEHNLEEVHSWPSVSPELKQQIREFLKRYHSARAAS